MPSLLFKLFLVDVAILLLLDLLKDIVISRLELEEYELYLKYAY